MVLQNPAFRGRHFHRGRNGILMSDTDKWNNSQSVWVSSLTMKTGNLLRKRDDFKKIKQHIDIT